MPDAIKRDKSGRFAKLAVAAQEEAQKLQAKEGSSAKSVENAEMTRKLVAIAFTKATAQALTEGGGASSIMTGVKATPGALASVIGGLVGEKMGGVKGKAIGQIIGGTIAGGLTTGVVGAISGGAGAAAFLDTPGKQALTDEIKKAQKLAAKSKSAPEFENMASPALKAIDDSVKTATREIGKKADRELKKIGDELAKNGLSEIADTTGRLSSSAAIRGGIAAAINTTGSGLLGNIATGAAKGLPGIGIGVGATAGGKLGEKMGGTTGKAIGTAIGGAIGGGVGGAFTAGPAGIFSGAAVGGAVGLSMVNPVELTSVANQIGDAAKNLAKSQRKQKVT